MIVQYICYRCRVPAAIRTQAGNTFPDGRVLVGIGIDAAVKQNTLLNPGLKSLPGIAFDEIANEVAQQQICICIREQTMRDVVHDTKAWVGRQYLERSMGSINFRIVPLPLRPLLPKVAFFGMSAFYLYENKGKNLLYQ